MSQPSERVLSRKRDRKARFEERKRKLDKILEGLSAIRDPKIAKMRQEIDEQVAREKATTSRIFVGNLSHTVTHKTLARVFKICGPITKVIISCFTYRPDSTAFAEIEFNDPAAYATAAHLNGLLLEGRALMVCCRVAETPEWKKHSKKSSEVGMARDQPQEAARGAAEIKHND